MPITKELKNVRNFESAGFSHEQAETLADAIEESHADSQESLKDFIHIALENQTKNFDIKLSALDNRLSKQMSDLDNRLSKQMSDLVVHLGTLETRLMVSQKDLLIKLFGIIIGTVGVAVTILKLF